MLVTNIMRPQIVDAILSTWAPEDECLTYSQIKQRSAAKGIIKETNDRSLSRWLSQLVKDGMLKKTENGYLLETKPKAYQVFDYLNELRQKYPNYIYEGEVGGWISHTCALTYLNFDETLIQKFDEKLAFDIISTRIGELFGALYLLRNDILKKRCGLAQLRLNDEVVREALFGLLTKSIGEHCETSKLVKKYLPTFRELEKKMFEPIWEANKPKEHFDRVDRLDHDLFFDRIEENPQSYKKSLKGESIDIDKYATEELIDKYCKISKLIEEKYRPKTAQLPYSYTLTKEESELEHNYRMAVLTKVAECIKALETSTEDFGIIITRHPATMNEYFTPEHILYESMKWAASPPKDDFLKKLWQETRDEEKSFEAMVADRLSAYNNLNKEIIEELRSKPWVKNELSKLGNFDEILRLYAMKRRKHLEDDRRNIKSFMDRIDKGLGKFKEKEDGATS
jgi:hypothetical protein